MSSSPTPQVYSRQQYATSEFWNNRYKQKQTYFDWYAQFPQLKQCFETIYNINPTNTILMLGCGNSKLSQQMYQHGYHNIVNIDISDVVIQQMKKISQQKGYDSDKMKWIVMDATDMRDIHDGSFDVVVDKGTLDALISGKNVDVCAKMLKESMRVLKKQGQFLLITYGSPEGRKKFFQTSIGLHKVDLSSMSTLINLMRSNLGNQPLSAITKDTDAMKKSLMEFNLIKVLRRNRKNEKKYVIWSDLMAVKEEVEEQHLEQGDKKEAKEVKNEAESLQKTAMKQQQPTSKKNENGDKEQQKQKQQKVNYNPKKQSFCYVYSISQKFAINLPQACQNLNIPQHFPSSSSSQSQSFQLSPTSISPDTQQIKICPLTPTIKQSLLKSVYYLQQNQIDFDKIVVCSSMDMLMEGKQKVKFGIKEGKGNVLNAYRKSLWRVQVKGNIGIVQGKIQELERMLVEEAGLNAYPSPRNYAYLGILLQKLQYKQSHSKFLQKYWYPTHKLHSSNQNIHTYIISIAPSIPSTLLPQIFNKIFKGTEYPAKSTKVTNICHGYINYFQPNLMTLFSFASMTYCDGEQLDIVVTDFMGNEMEQQGIKQNENGPILEIKQGKVQLILARILSAL